MSSLVVSEIYIAVSKGMHLDLFDHTNHTVLEIPITSKAPEDDTIADLTISSDLKHIALITSASKELHVFNLPDLSTPHTFSLPRSASKIRFTTDNKNILVADKSGDALIFDINQHGKYSGVKLLGHLSLLLDILQTEDKRFIITTDRDEKIRVSSYPNTYNIQTYCLGHTEFVGHIELLPHNTKYLVSSSGDGFIKIWDYMSGKLQHSIDTSTDITETKLKDEFVKTMDAEGLQVSNLPVVHLAVTKDGDSRSLLGTMAHSSNELLVYSVETLEGKIQHKLKEKIKLPSFPADIKFHNKAIFVYDNQESKVVEYTASETGYQSYKEIKMFNEKIKDSKIKCNLESIKLLYKRKFDNVQEYQERKKQRLENK